MTTYSQYDTTTAVVSTHYTFTCNGVSSDAVRYSAGNGKNIAFETSANAPGYVHVWRDDGFAYPVKFAHSSSGPWLDRVDDAATIYLSADTSGTSGVGSFTSPQWQYSSGNPANSGPTVTSITSGYIVTDDTVTNTDFTLLKNGSAYANTNISLTAATIQLPSDAQVAGYTYTLQYDGSAYYSATIDSQTYEEFYYDDSWTASPSSGRQTTSNRILNVISTIPEDTVIKSGSNSVTSVFSNNGRVLTHTYTADLSSISLSANTTIDIIFFVEQRLVNNVEEIVGVFYEKRSADGLINYWQSSPVYIIGNQATMTRTQYLMGVTTTFSVTDWVYSDEPEGDGYVAPVTTTSNGGGKRRRYPIISTNLFDRQRSIYSIGNTHKDETLF
jgi:hypothetical protein